MCPSDTSPEAWRVFIDLQRAMPTGEKLRRALELSDSLIKMAAAGFRRQYPRAGEREIFLRVARQRLGRELFERVYGSELSDEGVVRERSQ